MQFDLIGLREHRIFEFAIELRSFSISVRTPRSQYVLVLWNAVWNNEKRAVYLHPNVAKPPINYDCRRCRMIRIAAMAITNAFIFAATQQITQKIAEYVCVLQSRYIFCGPYRKQHTHTHTHAETHIIYIRLSHLISSAMSAFPLNLMCVCASFQCVPVAVLYFFPFFWFIFLVFYSLLASVEFDSLDLILGLAAS